MGVPCATWAAYGTRLLKREADLSEEVGSIRESLYSVRQSTRGLCKKGSVEPPALLPAGFVIALGNLRRNKF